MKERITSAVGSALRMVNEELGFHKSGAGRVSSEAQLRLIRDKLLIIQDQIESENLPPKQERVRGIGRMVTDSWPFDSKVGSVLLDVEQKYLQL